MTAGNGPLRFRRKPFNPKGNYSSEPKWHRSAREVGPNEYKQLMGLCGYITPPSIALFLGYQLSRAVKPKHGDLCVKCEKVARDEELHASLNPKKKEEDHG